MGYEFQIGQRVVAVRDNPANSNSIMRGDTGTVMDLSPSSLLNVGVEWDEEVAGGHSLELTSGKPQCKRGHGWYVHDYDIETISVDVDDSGVAADDDFWALIGL